MEDVAEELGDSGEGARGASLRADRAAVILDCTSPAPLRGGAETAGLRDSAVGAALRRDLSGRGNASMVGGNVEGAFDGVGRCVPAAERDSALGGGLGGIPA